MNKIIFKKPIGYLHYKLFLEKKKPFEERCLWVNIGLNKYIKDYVNKNMQILEFGAGGSTLFFSDNCEKVDSVEESEDWKKIVKNNFKKNNVKFYNSKKLPSKKNKYDIVLVDGGDRKRYSKLALDYVKDNGIVIIDNIEREKEKKYFDQIRDNFNNYKIFSGFAMDKAGYTSTAVLYK
jgi:predicted O-methyltransferase YrrM